MFLVLPLLIPFWPCPPRLWLHHLYFFLPDTLFGLIMRGNLQSLTLCVLERVLQPTNLLHQHWFSYQTYVPFLVSLLFPYTYAGMDMDRQLSQFRVQTLWRGDDHNERLDNWRRDQSKRGMTWRNRMKSRRGEERAPGGIDRRETPRWRGEETGRGRMDNIENKLWFFGVLSFLMNLLAVLFVGHLERQENARIFFLPDMSRIPPNFCSRMLQLHLTLSCPWCLYTLWCPQSSKHLDLDVDTNAGTTISSSMF